MLLEPEGAMLLEPEGAMLLEPEGAMRQERQASSGRGAPMLHVTPPRLLFDELPEITVAGCVPRSPVTLRAEMEGDDGRVWGSWASFTTDDDGSLDLEARTPEDGTYFGLGPSGLLWGMEPKGGPERVRPYFRESLEEVAVRLTLEGRHGRELAELHRTVLAPGVVRREVEPGTFFLPANLPAPGVVLLGSGPAGVHEDGGALLASRGYAALVVKLAVPRALPVETVGQTVDWLRCRQEVCSGGVVLCGTGRAGELALLAATVIDHLRGVVTFSASGLVFQGDGGPAWSCQGQPVDYVPLDWGKLVSREPISTRPVYAEAVVDRMARDRGRIAVEKIGCPVLLVSGVDDRVWPSSAFSELVAQRLGQRGFDHPFRHLTFQDAGHLLGPLLGYPHRPTGCLLLRDDQTLLVHATGGSRAGQAHAQRESWQAFLEFLQQQSPQTKV